MSPGCVCVCLLSVCVCVCVPPVCVCVCGRGASDSRSVYGAAPLWLKENVKQKTQELALREQGAYVYIETEEEENVCMQHVPNNTAEIQRVIQQHNEFHLSLAARAAAAHRSLSLALALTHSLSLSLSRFLFLSLSLAHFQESVSLPIRVFY